MEKKKEKGKFSTGSVAGSMEAAVVSVSHGAIGFVIAKLGDLLAGKYKLLKQAKGEIMFLKAELESMRAFLERMSEAEEEPDPLTRLPSSSEASPAHWRGRSRRSSSSWRVEPERGRRTVVGGPGGQSGGGTWYGTPGGGGWPSG